MAEDAHRSLSRLQSRVDIPDELIANILLHSSTPTFVQLTRTSKQFQHIAKSSRELLLRHLLRIPGDKSTYEDSDIDNEKLFLLLRQRAANHLYGASLTANMHEHLVRNAQLDPSASSISGLDADYVRMTLVYKESQMLNMYTNHCSIKERIEGNFGQNVKILKLVQWARWVSCLISWRKEDDLDVTGYESVSDESEAEVLDQTSFKPTANARLAQFYLSHQEPKIGCGRKRKVISDLDEYRIVHFDVYTIEDSQTFIIEPYLDYVPRDLAVHSTTHCAVLWDRDTPKGRPTEDATIVVYTATKAQLLYPVKYEEKIVWPKAGKPERTNVDSDDDDSPEYLPGSIAFFKEGRRIKLYDAGSVVPFEVTSTTSTQYDQYASTNVIRFDGFEFNVDTPFFGTHATYWDEMNQHSFCFQTHLCLGLSTIDIGDDEHENQVRVLCILRSQTRLYPENCEHTISLQRMTHVSAGNSTVVARLWGFEELHTNLTGKEIVAVSPAGTRIAIAMWDKVYVYPINPKVLCEDVVVDSSDDELKSKRRKKKSRKPWASTTTNYYNRNKDRHLLGWRIVEIQPIVLDLKGAVAHKLNWSVAKGPVTDTYVPETVIVVKEEDVPEPVVEGEGFSQVPCEDGAAEVVAEVVALEDSDVDPAIALVGSSEAQTQPTITETHANSAMEEMLMPLSAEEQSSSLQGSNEQHIVDVPHMSAPEDEASQEVVSTLTNPASIETKSSSSLPSLSTTSLIDEESTQMVTPTIKVETPLSPPTSLIPAPATNTVPPLASGALPAVNGIVPLSPASINVPVQPAKPSSKRKEKSPEVSNCEITILTGSEKEKHQQTHSLDARLNGDVPPAPLPVLHKTMPKLKQTVSEILSAPPSPPPPSPQQQSQPEFATEPVWTAMPSAETSDPHPQSTPPPCQTQTSTDIAVLESEPTPEMKTGEASEKEAIISDLSKGSTTAATESPADTSSELTSVAGQSPKDNDTDKIPKRKKRITEDELIILTDRGVQVWNVGARAKGKRKKSILPLEESLKGRLPRRKGKAKEVVEDIPEDGDVD